MTDIPPVKSQSSTSKWPKRLAGSSPNALATRAIPRTLAKVRAYLRASVLHTRGIHPLNNSSVADIISAVEFDKTGDFLATGDRGGRVVLFERNRSVMHQGRLWLISLDFDRSFSRAS